MNRNLLLPAISVIALLAGGAWWYAWHSHERDARLIAPSTVTAGKPEAASAHVAALASTPQARAYGERQGFERDIKRFLADAGVMGAAERSQQAAILDAAVEDAARAGQLSAGEAFLLQAALIKAVAPEGREQGERLARLAERYRADAARREAAWADRLERDPQFRDYKSREAAIVTEVAAMTTIPEGLTRDQYLRLRLQQERERAYR